MRNLKSYALMTAFVGVLFASPAQAGDYNSDGLVNAADYTVWQNSSNVQAMDVDQAMGAIQPPSAAGGAADRPHFLLWVSNSGPSTTQSHDGGAQPSSGGPMPQTREHILLARRSALPNGIPISSLKPSTTPGSGKAMPKLLESATKGKVY